MDADTIKEVVEQKAEAVLEEKKEEIKEKVEEVVAKVDEVADKACDHRLRDCSLLLQNWYLPCLSEERPLRLVDRWQIQDNVGSYAIAQCV
jgi:hypothetical protein